MDCKAQIKTQMLALFGVLMVLTYAYVINAWIADDAFISLRSILQLFAGHGPRWNPHERVQVFTHPLWFMLTSLNYIWLKDLPLILYLQGWVLTLAAFYVLRVYLPLRGWLLAAVLLISSKFFIDYSSSGLENSLCYLLIALFYSQFLRQKEDKRSLAIMFGSFGLLILTRQDLLLLVILPVISLLRKDRLWMVACALAPYALWSLFSLIYYGFLFPNTGYAKLMTGVSLMQAFAHATIYIVRSIQADPLLSLPFLTLLCLPCAKHDRRTLLALGSIALNLLYIGRVGGDFMGGRFLTFSYLLSVMLVCDFFKTARFYETAVIAVLLTLSLPHPPLLTPGDYVQKFFPFGVADEKGFYFQETSLHAYLTKPDYPNVSPWRTLALQNAQSPQKVFIFSNIGIYGIYTGLDKIIIDQYGLSDPLLARLPAMPNSRVGHYKREIPKGYLDSLYLGQDYIDDPKINQLNQDVKLVTQGAIWSKERWRAILRLNHL